MDMREIGQILCLVAFWLSLFMSFMTINSDDVRKISTTAVKMKVFNSPQINLSPGSVCNKYYYDIDFPRGHIALKSFSAELVDGNGVRVPLHEAYLHHWTVFRYYGLIDSDTSKPKVIHVGNSGPCKKLLGQYFGLGSETRKTNNWVPNPYGIEVGNPKDIPEGYEERWVMNVHAIDTRGVVDKLGCTECRCSLYNVTKAPTGQPLPKEYVGGLYCCEDQTHCRLKEGFSIETRKLFMRYTVRWMDWDDSILPVKIYLFDVTYTLKDHSDVSDITLNSSCKIEYTVEPCNIGEHSNSSCLDIVVE